MPTESKIQDALEKRIADKPLAPKPGPPRSRLPSRAEFYEACLCSPRPVDLAGYFSVHRKTIFDWFKKKPELQIIYDEVKSLDKLEHYAVARKKGLEGSIAHQKVAIAMAHPDALEPENQITINQTTVKVLGTAREAGDLKPFKVIEGEAEHVHTPDKPTDNDSGLPLFNGKVFRP